MIIKKIKLENIRSYLNQEIDFPTGSVLLSGDIGTGKSSVLLAIDFALFGLRRGTLSGSSLLRNGKNSGSIELNFIIDDKDVTIKRNLKRTPESVVQDSGYILINGAKKEGTAVELKQTILDLLNYPKELLTKSKSLIYRYTVYTPQEEMKHILLGDKDFRLDTLRRVFGIDKYKRIKENTEKFIFNLKGKRKEFSGMIADLEEKKSEKKEKEKEISSIEKQVKTLLAILNNLKKEETEKKTQIKEIEDKINKLKEFKKELAVADTELNNKIEQRKESEKELEEVNKQIKNLEIELKEKKEIKLEETKKEISEKEKQINTLENAIKKLNNQLNEFQVKKNNSEEIKDKISKLDVCPLCKQKVTEEHVSKVLEIENKNIKEFVENTKKFKNQLNGEEKKLNQTKKELEKLREKEHSHDILKLKIESLKEKTDSKNNIQSSQLKSKKEIGEINLKKSKLFKEIEQFKDIEKIYEKEKLSLENLQEKLKETEIKKVSLDKEIDYINNIITDLKKEIKEKLKIKEKLLYLNQLQHWLEAHFTKLMETMEKKIMVKIHYDFNSLFQKWFDMLVEGELLNIKLDEEFTPIIIQNDYEIDYNYLSGGEKTAAALAYRLALNQIINTLIAVIKTKDLLILDEPTDGFSTEQLDRVKIVIDELDAKQIILVSHEAKVESFVENVIKFDKKEHITEISE